MIIGVAVKYGDLTICLPKPNRHHNCIREAVVTLGLIPPIGEDGQGFYLADGTYLDRVQALQYVKDNNQPLRNPQAHRQLYSEDLW